MITIWMTYLVAAVAASGVFMVAGWRSKQGRQHAPAYGRHVLSTDALWNQEEFGIKASEAQADVATAIRLALKRLAPVMANQSVQAEIAAAPGLLVRMRAAALADLLEELLAAAIYNAPASRLLLTAAPFGDHIHVGITDDMPGADPAMRLGSIRGLIERVAMRGAALDIDVRQSEGTTMTLRVAAANKVRQDNKDRALAAS